MNVAVKQVYLSEIRIFLKETEYSAEQKTIF